MPKFAECFMFEVVWLICSIMMTEKSQTIEITPNIQKCDERKEDQKHTEDKVYTKHKL